MATMASMKIIFEPEELEGLKLDEFFELVSRTCGMPYDNPKFQVNCTKINVAANIQDGFYKAYEKLVREKGQFNDETTYQITMILCRSGPKAYDDFPDNTVEVQRGAFFLGKDELPIRFISAYADFFPNGGYRCES